MISRRELLALAAMAWLPRVARGGQGLEVMRFSGLAPGSRLPEALQPYVFPNQPRRTSFSLVEDGGRTVLRARADASASGIVRALRVELHAYPLLAWSWNVLRPVLRGDPRRKSGDDYAARLYVTFDLDPETLGLGERMQLALARAVWGASVPAAALCYVWDLRAREGTFEPNPYTDRVRMIVVDGAAAAPGQWRAHQRDVAADYRRAFGAEPRAVNGVIVSADTDNTGERAESYFSDIEFRPRPPS